MVHRNLARRTYPPRRICRMPHHRRPHRPHCRRPQILLMRTHRRLLLPHLDLRPRPAVPGGDRKENMGVGCGIVLNSLAIPGNLFFIIPQGKNPCFILSGIRHQHWPDINRSNIKTLPHLCLSASFLFAKYAVIIMNCTEFPTIQACIHCCLLHQKSYFPMLPDVYQIFKHTQCDIYCPTLSAVYKGPVTFKTPVVFLLAIPQHTTALSASTSGTILPLKRMA